jgi:hypothetical protein
VIHPHCVGISDIPEDDWYCSSCTLKLKATGGISAMDFSVEKEDNESIAKPPTPT